MYDDAIAFPVGAYKAKANGSENSHFGAKPIKSLEKVQFWPPL
jgi:peptidyl-tRNA hydrolase